MEAGMSKMAKTILFLLWRNGTYSRNRGRDRQLMQVSRQYDEKLMKAPLLAWKKFTKDELMNRKDGQINELEITIKLLRKQVALLSIEKETAQEEITQLNDRLVYSVLINDDYIETIRVLKSDLADEKKRVLTLAALCEPVKELSTTLGSYGQGECDHFADVLVDTGCHVNTYDYGKMFNQANRDVIVSLGTLREERKNKPSTKTRFLFKLESEAATKILLQWVNFVSRECVNGIEEPTEDGDRFETLLPRHEQIYDLAQLYTGRTLSRVIFYLIYCGSHIDRGKVAGAQSFAAGIP
jgi:hypothetical protein